MRTCSHCHKAKPHPEFYRDKSKKDGLSSRCKKCQRRQAREWADKNPEARQRIMHDWKLRTNLSVHNRKIWIKRAYDKTPEDIELLFVNQNGRCAICQRKLGEYHIDHDHATEKVRGLLCRGCNLGCGFFKDSPKRLTAAIHYLQVAR